MNQAIRARLATAALFDDSAELIVTYADLCHRSRRLLDESARACELARHTRQLAADTAGCSADCRRDGACNPVSPPTRRNNGRHPSPREPAVADGPTAPLPQVRPDDGTQAPELLTFTNSHWPRCCGDVMTLFTPAEPPRPPKNPPS